ncbi:hypothetical protein [Enterococcus faecalis]|uniref:hypothetical protein n=1 Tax=Enterococcus faecalis TaxID=1351 RepID=UPI003CC65111
MSNDFRDLKSNTENKNKENHNKKDKSLDILKDKLKNTDYKQKINDLDIESKAKFALEKTKEGLTKTKEVYQAEETQIMLKKAMNMLYKLFRYYPLFLFKYKLRLKYVMSGNADFMLGMSKKEKEEIIKEFNKKNLLATLYLYSPFLIILLSIFFAYCLQNIGYGLKPLIFFNLALLIFPIFQHFRISTGRADVDTIINYYLEKGVGLSDLREIVEKYEEIRKDFRDIYLTGKSRITDMTLDFDDKLGVVLQLDLENIDDKPINTLANIDYLKPFDKYGDFYLVADNKAYLMFDIFLSKSIYNRTFDFVEFFKDDEAYFNYFKDYEALRNTRDLNKLKQELEKANLDISADIVNILQKKINKKNEDNQYVLGFSFNNNLGKNLSGDSYEITMICNLATGKLYKNIVSNLPLIERELGYDVKIRPHKNKANFYLDIKLADRKRNVNDLKQAIRETNSESINVQDLKNVLTIIDENTKKFGFHAPFKDLIVEGNDKYFNITLNFNENAEVADVLNNDNKKKIANALKVSGIRLNQDDFDTSKLILTVLLQATIDNYPVTFNQLVESAENNQIILGMSQKGEVKANMTDDAFHALISGVTGYGKTVAAVLLIVQLLYNTHKNFKDVFVISGAKLGDYYAMGLGKSGAIVQAVGQETVRGTTLYADDKVKALISIVRVVYLEGIRRDTFFRNNGFENIDTYNKYARENGFEELGSILLVLDEWESLLKSFGRFRVGKTKANLVILDYVNQIRAIGRSMGIVTISISQSPVVKELGEGFKKNMTVEFVGNNDMYSLSGVDDSRSIFKEFTTITRIISKDTMLKKQAEKDPTKREKIEDKGPVGYMAFKSGKIRPFTEPIEIVDGYGMLKTAFIDPKEVGKHFDKKYNTMDKYWQFILADDIEDVKSDGLYQDMYGIEPKKLGDIKVAEPVETKETIEENCDLETESQDTNTEVEVAEEEVTKPLNEVTNEEEETNSNADLTEIFKDLDL